jgi:hypothetical protein
VGAALVTSIKAVPDIDPTVALIVAAPAPPDPAAVKRPEPLIAPPPVSHRPVECRLRAISSPN